MRGACATRTGGRSVISAARPLRRVLARLLNGVGMRSMMERVLDRVIRLAVVVLTILALKWTFG
jgi:hypothetical protein